MKVKILKGNAAAGIRELEVFSSSPYFPWNEVPFVEYQEKKEKKRFNSMCYIVYKLFWFIARANNIFRKKLQLSHW